MTSNNLPIRFCLFLFVVRKALKKKNDEEIRGEQPSPSPSLKYNYPNKNLYQA